MTLLLVKTSSLGDLLHTLPALTDLKRQRPDLRVHWVVEESFSRIPSWSPAVEKTIPVALRRWRRNPWQAIASGEFPRFMHALRQDRHELVLDAQGLMKSAWIARAAHGPALGLDREAIREPLAALFYHRTVTVEKERHAVDRLRRLFALGLGLPAPEGPPDFGLTPDRFGPSPAVTPCLVFLHGTTWISKQWPESHWCQLARIARRAGVEVLLPWGNPEEEARARRIAEAAPECCRVAPRMNLDQLATCLIHARAVIAVDSGPAHLAAATGAPTLCLYGPTDEQRIGVVGTRTTRLSGLCPLAPCRKRLCPLPASPGPSPACLASLDPEQVWQAMEHLP